MLTITTVLLLVACLCFLLAAFNVTSKVGLVAFGLALWVLTQLVR